MEKLVHGTSTHMGINYSLKWQLTFFAKQFIHSLKTRVQNNFTKHLHTFNKWLVLNVVVTF